MFFMEFRGPQALGYRPGSLSHIVRRALASARPATGSSYSLDRKFRLDLPGVSGL